MMKEISLAENVDSVLSRRAKVEAMNIANRTPGVADVAWKMEKGKIEGAMSNFQKNINKITLMGELLTITKTGVMCIILSLLLSR